MAVVRLSSQLPPLPSPVFAMIRDYLNGRELAITMSVNKTLNDLTNDSRTNGERLHRLKMTLHWRIHVGKKADENRLARGPGDFYQSRPGPYEAIYSLQIEGVDFNDRALEMPRNPHSGPFTLDVERALTCANVLASHQVRHLTFRPHIVSIFQQLQRRVTLKDRAVALCWRAPSTLSLLAYSILLIKDSFQTHPLLSVTVLVIAAGHAFLREKRSLTYHVIVLSKIGFRLIRPLQDIGLESSRMVLRDRAIPLVERIDRFTRSLFISALPGLFILAYRTLWIVLQWLNSTVVANARTTFPTDVNRSFLWSYWEAFLDNYGVMIGVTFPVAVMSMSVFGNVLGTAAPYLAQRAYPPSIWH